MEQAVEEQSVAEGILLPGVDNRTARVVVVVPSVHVDVDNIVLQAAAVDCTAWLVDIVVVIVVVGVGWSSSPHGEATAVEVEDC